MLSSTLLTSTHCPYCAMQCGMHLRESDGEVEISGDVRFPVNKGALCIKGWSAAETLRHPARLLSPLIRDDSGELVPASWPDALDYVAERIRDLHASHGPQAVGVFGSGSLTNEKAYLLGKFARVALGTPNIDYNGRFCMSSAAAAATRAFGVDRGLPFPVEDLPDADVILLAGSNVAETMPPLMQYFAQQQQNGGRLIVADPRRSATAQWASLHLKIKPGSDAALANGLLHLLIKERMIDYDFIATRTEHFDQVRHVAATYWPERVERLTGICEADLVEAAQALGRANRAVVLTGRGPEQQAQGVNNALAYINLALALGQVGRRGGGYGTITGQGNGQGGREHGQKADQLPGYRRIDDLDARKHIADVWGVPERSLPGPGRSAVEMFDAIGRPGGIRALIVVGSNPVVSAPDNSRVQARMMGLDLLVVSDFFLSETAQIADVVLPVAQWAEEDGSVTNLEGRVIRRHRAVDPPAGVRTDLEVLVALAERLGKRDWFPTTDASEIFEELCRATRGGLADYSAMSYARLDAEGGLFWPCTEAQPGGTPRLFADEFPTPSGRARFHAITHRTPAEERDAEFPLFLTTGRVLAQYQSGTQTRHVSRLQALAPEPLAEIHPATARRFKLLDGGWITVTTRRGQARARLQVNATMRRDTIFLPFHWGGEQSANRVTIAALDPISRMPEFKVCAARVSPEGGAV